MEKGDNRSRNNTVLTINISSSVFSALLFLLGGVVSAILVSNLGIFLPTRKSISGTGTTELSTLPNTEVQKFDYGLRNWPVSASQKSSVSPDVAGEVQAAVNQALDAQSIGRKEKAHKLFQHALALDPSHADTLNAYGEFIEEEDIIKANHFYSCALISNDSHSKALMNRERTSAAVAEIDKRMFAKVDEKREQLGLQIPDNNGALQRAQEEFYYLQIYHTTAIEGNTLSLEQMRSIMETGLAVGGKSVMEHNEVLGLNLALQFINNTLMHRFGKITVDDILQIHKRVLGHVDPLGAGSLRTTQVFVGGYIPPPSVEINDLMDDFVEWMNSEEALSLHPVEFAALAHYKFVYIHPFMDGNGRTSRLLMNLILLRTGYPPVIVKLSQRQQYYETIKQANAGDIRPFIRFICNCLDDMLDAYLWLTSDSPSSLPEIEEGKRLVTDL
ncbi:protein adenylyltransferase FICD-like [Lytechinus variegatus]|uniref:protein adenylyltransferase FICD-like n=1 Tax=Lytechinus variegatus TaxID=7654 RepID=UPI001BB255B0|nr:protein adenylyltransferase FICD-like [Lytechinus variegatus]